MNAIYQIKLKFIVKRLYAKHCVCSTQWKAPLQKISGSYPSRISNLEKEGKQECIQC